MMGWLAHIKGAAINAGKSAMSGGMPRSGGTPANWMGKMTAAEAGGAEGVYGPTGSIGASQQSTLPGMFGGQTQSGSSGTTLGNIRSAPMQQAATGRGYIEQILGRTGYGGIYGAGSDMVQNPSGGNLADLVGSVLEKQGYGSQGQMVGGAAAGPRPRAADDDSWDAFGRQMNSVFGQIQPRGIEGMLASRGQMPGYMRRG